MYSDHPPQVVLPDTREGRDAVIEFRAEGVEVGLCDEFVEDEHPLHNEYSPPLKATCRARFPLGDRTHNWCMRCMAGFPQWLGDADTDPSERYGFLTGSI